MKAVNKHLPWYWLCKGESWTTAGTGRGRTARIVKTLG